MAGRNGAAVAEGSGLLIDKGGRGSSVPRDDGRNRVPGPGRSYIVFPYPAPCQIAHTSTEVVALGEERGVLMWLEQNAQRWQI